MNNKTVDCSWGTFADSIYHLVFRLMKEKDADVATLGKVDVQVATIPCLCALTAYAAECGHTCLPLRQIAGRTIGKVLDLLRSTDDEGDNIAENEVMSIELPCLDVMLSLVKKCPKIVAHEGDDNSNGCPPFILRNNLLLVRRHDQDERYLMERVGELGGLTKKDACARPKGLTEDERAMFPKKDHPNEVDQEKVEAAARLLTHQFTILNGGPGTGKTFTLARVIACALKSCPEMRVRLAAPSAKAGARMKQSIMQSKDALEKILDDHTKAMLFGGEADALTVDKLLEKSRDFVNYKRNEENTLEADWVIVDEASMLSLPMATSLIKALPSGCRLTLVGDFNQLPSVDLGHVFADLCAAFPSIVSTLKTSNRFEPGGSVDRLAKAMLGEGGAAGAKPADMVIGLLRDKQISRDVTWHPLTDVSHENSALWEEFDKCVLAGFKPLLDSTKDQKAAVEAIGAFCVLSAMRHRRRLGCISLNRRITEYLVQSVPQEGGHFKIPTLNLVTQNVYEPVKLCNGDSFVVLPTDGQTALLASPDGQVQQVPLAFIPQYELAFAETVHKVQGSEFDNVAIVLSDQDDSSLLTREMFYTALTRVKKGGHVDIWGSESAIRKCVSTPTSRFTPQSCME